MRQAVPKEHPVTAKPPRGRPSAAINPADLPDVARVLRPHLTPAVRTAIRETHGLGVATLHGITAGTIDPRISTLRAILATIRPGDRDGGWGWFGRALAKAAGRSG